MSQRFHLLLLVIVLAMAAPGVPSCAQASKSSDEQNPASHDSGDKAGKEQNSGDKSPSGSHSVDFPTMEGPVELRSGRGARVTLKLTDSSTAVYQAIARQGKINVIFDPDYTPRPTTIDVSGVSLEDGLKIAAFLTRTFWRPVTPDTIFVTNDTGVKRREFEQQVIKTFYVPVKDPTDLQDVVNELRVILDVSKILPLQGYHTISVRATPEQMAVAEKLVEDLTKTKQKSEGQYRLEFRVRESSGDKPVTSRTYSLLLQPYEWGKLRIGPQIPVETSEKSKTYVSAGKNIDCKVQSETEHAIGLRTTVEFSDVGLDEHGAPQSAHNDPVLQQLRMETSVTLELGTPSVIGSFEDPVSKHNVQIEATAVRTKTKD